ncbi:MAG: FHA domain-containing protein [Myxococcaceae bacterium]
MSDPPQPSRRQNTGSAALINPRRSAPAGGSVALLACRAGPCAGQEFALNGAEILIGRATASDIAIPDTSVSRKHLRLRWTSEGWTATDLGSGNGTLVNGESIRGETLLHSGDLLLVGDTELTFSESWVERGEARLRRRSRMIPVSLHEDEPTPLSGTWALRGLVLLLAVLICGLGYRLVTQRRAVQARQAAAATERARQKVSAVLEDVKKLIMAGKYKAAKTRLNGVTAAEDQRALVAMYRESCAKEIPNEELLEAARTELAKDLPGSAKQALRKIPTNTLQMNLVAEVDRLVQAKLKSRLMEASEAFRRSEYQVAIDLTDDLLQGMPGNREVTDLRNDATTALRRSGKREPLSRGNFTINSSEVSAAATLPARSSIAREVLERYQNGEISAALEIADSCSTPR